MHSCRLVYVVRTPTLHHDNSQQTINFTQHHFRLTYCLPSILQSSWNKEGHGAQTHEHPPPSVPPPVEQKPRSSSPVQKPPDSSPPAPHLPPPNSHTESEAESLLEELQFQAGLAGELGDTTTYFNTHSWTNSNLWGLKGSTLSVFASSCRFRGSCTAAESYWSCRRGWSIICQCLSSQSVNPLLRPSLLLFSGPPQPGKPQTATPHCCHTQVTDFKLKC